MKKLIFIESCGCCWHFTLKGFGFGKKDKSYYLLIFGKTIWSYQLQLLKCLFGYHIWKYELSNKYEII